jgi:hypothetical protein
MVHIMQPGTSKDHKKDQLARVGICHAIFALSYNSLSDKPLY